MSYINFNEKSIDQEALLDLTKSQLLALNKQFVTEFNEWKDRLGISVAASNRRVIISTGMISKEDLLKTLEWAQTIPAQVVQSRLYNLFNEDFEAVIESLKSAGFQMQVYKTAKSNTLIKNPLIDKLRAECISSYKFKDRSMFESENYFNAVNRIYHVLNTELLEEKKSQTEKKLLALNSEKFSLLVKEIQKYSSPEKALDLVSNSNGSIENLEDALKDLYLESMKGETVSCTHEPGDFECTGNYVVGERRCECGNRRCGLDVEIWYETSGDGSVSLEIGSDTTAY